MVNMMPKHFIYLLENHAKRNAPDLTMDKHLAERSIRAGQDTVSPSNSRNTQTTDLIARNNDDRA